MKKASARKPAKKNVVSRSRKPLDLQAIRAMIAKTVGGQALDITSALVEEAKKGELAPAKFLFEMIGLYPVSVGAADEEAEDAEDGNEFAKALLQRLALSGSGEDAEEATEFAGVTGTGNSVE
jgi:hypothetical protein